MDMSKIGEAVENARIIGWDFQECEGGYRYVTGKVYVQVNVKSVSLGIADSGVVLFHYPVTGNNPHSVLSNAGRAADTLANAFNEVSTRLSGL